MCMGEGVKNVRVLIDLPPRRPLEELETMIRLRPLENECFSASSPRFPFQVREERCLLFSLHSWYAVSCYVQSWGENESDFPISLCACVMMWRRNSRIRDLFCKGEKWRGNKICVPSSIFTFLCLAVKFSRRYFALVKLGGAISFSSLFSLPGIRWLFVLPIKLSNIVRLICRDKEGQSLARFLFSSALPLSRLLLLAFVLGRGLLSKLRVKMKIVSRIFFPALFLALAPDLTSRKLMKLCLTEAIPQLVWRIDKRQKSTSMFEWAFFLEIFLERVSHFPFFSQGALSMAMDFTGKFEQLTFEKISRREAYLNLE